MLWRAKAGREVVFVGYGLFAACVRDHVDSGAFAALGARLALSDR